LRVPTFVQALFEYCKNAALRRKSKDGFARNQNNVSEWSDISTQWLVSSPCQRQCELLSSLRRLSFVVYVYNIENYQQKVFGSDFNLDISFHILEPFFMKQLITDRDEMSNRYRGPSINSYNGFSNNATDINDFLCKILGYW
jgi:hypothetical protein